MHGPNTYPICWIIQAASPTAVYKGNPKAKVAKKIVKPAAKPKAKTQIFYAPKKKAAAPGQDYYAEMMKSLEAPPPKSKAPAPTPAPTPAPETAPAAAEE